MRWFFFKGMNKSGMVSTVTVRRPPSFIMLNWGSCLFRSILRRFVDAMENGAPFFGFHIRSGPIRSLTWKGDLGNLHSIRISAIPSHLREIERASRPDGTSRFSKSPESQSSPQAGWNDVLEASHNGACRIGLSGALIISRSHLAVGTELSRDRP